MHVRIAAREALEKAEAEARKATNSAGRHLVSALLDAGTIGAMTQRQARELLQDAQDGLAAALDASETLESELGSLKDSLSIADMIVANRFRDVVMADPAVKQAFDAFKTAQRILIDARRPLEILASRRLIPHEFRFWNHEDIHSSGGQDWLTALAALETDPDALLPSAGG